MNRSIATKMKHRGLIGGLLISSLAVTACATAPIAPQGSQQARSDLTDLQNNPEMATRARAELRDAEAAVRLAERPLDEDDAALGKHRVYMAEQAVSLAETRASTRYAEESRSLLGDERDAARLRARTAEVARARDETSSAREAMDAAQRAEAQSEANATLKAAEYQRQIDALQAEITDRGLVLTLGDVLFATGKAELRSGTIDNLDRLVDFLNAYPERRAQIDGHTDNVGSAEYNRGLSQRRAESVRHYLTQQGIAARRLSVSGLGMDRPVADNDTASGRQQNRRVDIVIENPSQSSSAEGTY